MDAVVGHGNNDRRPHPVVYCNLEMGSDPSLLETGPSEVGTQKWLHGSSRPDETPTSHTESDHWQALHPCHAPAAQIRTRTPHTAHAGRLSGATRFDVCAVGTATTHGDLPQARHPTVVAVVRLVQGIRQSVEGPNVALDKQPRGTGPPVDTGR